MEGCVSATRRSKPSEKGVVGGYVWTTSRAFNVRCMGDVCDQEVETVCRKGDVGGCVWATRRSEPLVRWANMGACVWASRSPELFMSGKDGVSTCRTPPGLRETP